MALTSERSKQRKTWKAIKFLSICIDSTSKRSKTLTYVAKLSKQRKTPKVNKIPWIASIWCQNDQNNAKLEKWSKYHELHLFDDKTIKTTQNYESYRITMNCIDLTTKRSKCFVKSQDIENNSKLQKYSNYDEFGSIWSRNNKKYWLTSQTVQNKAKLIKLIKVQWIASISRQNDQNNAKLRELSNYDELHRNNAKLRKWSNYNELHR